MSDGRHMRSHVKTLHMSLHSQYVVYIRLYIVNMSFCLCIVQYNMYMVHIVLHIDDILTSMRLTMQRHRQYVLCKDVNIDDNIYVCTYTYIYQYVHVYIYIYIQIRFYTSIYVCTSDVMWIKRSYI